MRDFACDEAQLYDELRRAIEQRPMASTGVELTRKRGSRLPCVACSGGELAAHLLPVEAIHPNVGSGDPSRLLKKWVASAGSA